ncbi:LOW QUALITY PROTEIN: vascular endothelial growth factor D [Rhynchocyon petersi]
MYRRWAVVNILMMSFLHLIQGSSYDYGPVKRPSRSRLEGSEQQIRAASSLEELLRITHLEDWKLWRCRLKLKDPSDVDFRSASHRSTRFAATFYDIETLKVIDEEWQRTQCSPRETCVDVASELGQSTDTFFKPPCVNVFRCGGCCNEESLVCVNTSTSYISKQLFEISVPLTSVPELVPVKVANHTGCKCLSTGPSRHPYSIIRRSIQLSEENRCLHSKKICPVDMLWDNYKCKCVLRELDPRGGMEDHSHLKELALCGPHRKFDEDRCECVCKVLCPRDLIQHPENCSCFECRESLESCCQKQKIFHPDTCRCEDKCPPTRMRASGKSACAGPCRFTPERKSCQHVFRNAAGTLASAVTSRYFVIGWGGSSRQPREVRTTAAMELAGKYALVLLEEAGSPCARAPRRPAALDCAQGSVATVGGFNGDLAPEVAGWVGTPIALRNLSAFLVRKVTAARAPHFGGRGEHWNDSLLWNIPEQDRCTGSLVTSSSVEVVEDLRLDWAALKIDAYTFSV